MSDKLVSFIMSAYNSEISVGNAISLSVQKRPSLFENERLIHTSIRIPLHFKMV